MAINEFIVIIAMTDFALAPPVYECRWTVANGDLSAQLTLACSLPTYKRNVQLRRRNTSRKAASKSNAELDDKYERLRRVVGYCLAHKAWWHNE